MLALVSFYINSLPVSNWNTAPLSRAPFSPNIKMGRGAHAHTHPAEPRQHLEELIQRADKRFPESTKGTIRGASNSPPLLTQTHTHAYTHAHTARPSKRPDQMERGGTKSFTRKVLQHLRSTLPDAGVDFHRRWSFVHTSLCG